jgi:hypothetical protein
MKTFYDYYIEENRIKDIKNQKDCITAAKSIKLWLEGEIKSIPKKHKWLSDKLFKNIRDNYRGQFVKKDVLGIINEIIDPTNSSSKLYWSKSPRKQNVEQMQRDYIRLHHGLNILFGKTYNICASGNNSYRFMSDTFEFKKGIKKTEGSTTKSMDGRLESGILNTLSDCWTFQKVTTDDGGSTNSVEEEVIKTIQIVNKHFDKFDSQNIFIFILDGPYWGRKQYKEDNKTRFEKIVEISSNNVIVCDSNNIKDELRKRGLIKK